MQVPLGVGFSHASFPATRPPMLGSSLIPPPPQPGVTHTRLGGVTDLTEGLGCWRDPFCASSPCSPSGCLSLPQIGLRNPLPLDLLKRAISPSFCRLQASPEAECRLKPWRLSPRATQPQDRAGCRVSQSSFPPPVPQLLWDPGLLEFGQLVTEPSLRRASPRQRPPGHWSRLRNCRGRGPPDLAARGLAFSAESLQ